ncbi:MAG: hypothetical protein ISR55_11695 [Bacteroidetes bacterium]|nr:hypothetical protein [Bacteroidota bacterium]
MKRRIHFIIALFSFYLLSFPAVFGQKEDIKQDILNYVNSVVDKKVGRGECWDLLSHALNETGAKWFPTEDFGRIINYPEKQLQAGDMIRLINITYDWGGKTSRHYAIVYEVIDKNHLRIADQNVAGVRKVKIRDYHLDEIVKGEITFYRPYK